MTGQKVENYSNAWKWSKHEEFLVYKHIIGSSIHVCSGRSKVGDIQIDLTEKADIKADVLHLPIKNKSVDTVIADPPWNISFIPRFWKELERVARKRIIVICLSQFGYHGWKILYEKIIKRGQGFQLKVLTVYEQPNQTITTFEEKSQ